VININQSMIGSGTLEDYAKVASVMSHEGAHAYGEHVESNAYAFGGDSYLQMVRNVGLRGDGTFLGEMVKATLDPKNQMVNTGGPEYWRVMLDENGKIVKVQDDGDYSNVNFVDEEGNALDQVHLKGRLTTTGLAKMVKNVQSSDEINQVMLDSFLNNKLDGKGWFAVDSRGVYSTYANSAHPRYGRMEQTEIDRKEKVERVQWEKEHADEIENFNAKNKQATELMKQTDQYFKDKRQKTIVEAGCVFRNIQAFCEIASGRTLQGKEIVDVWDTAKRNEYLLSGGTVQNYSGVAEITLAKLNVISYSFEFGTNTNNGVLVGYIGTMPYNDVDTHKALYLSVFDSGKPFFNPGQTNNQVYANGWMPVYMHPRKKK